MANIELTSDHYLKYYTDLIGSHVVSSRKGFCVAVGEIIKGIPLKEKDIGKFSNLNVAGGLGFEQVAYDVEDGGQLRFLVPAIEGEILPSVRGDYCVGVYSAMLLLGVDNSRFMREVGKHVDKTKKVVRTRLDRGVNTEVANRWVENIMGTVNLGAAMVVRRGR